MEKKDLLFLGGLGAPRLVYTPWFIVLKWFGYNIHPVPNSLFTWDSVSTFSENLIQFSSGFEKVDVMGVSYGGNAALYGAYKSPEFCEKVRKMVLVCAPVLGAPGLAKPFRKLLPGFMQETLNEMTQTSDVARCIRELNDPARIPFDLHFLYHERDFIAPRETATLEDVGTSHRLDFQWQCIPGPAMHQAACINPKTLDTVVQILLGP